MTYDVFKMFRNDGSRSSTPAVTDASINRWSQRIIKMLDDKARDEGAANLYDFMLCNVNLYGNNDPDKLERLIGDAVGDQDLKVENVLGGEVFRSFDDVADHDSETAMQEFYVNLRSNIMEMVKGWNASGDIGPGALKHGDRNDLKRIMSDFDSLVAQGVDDVIASRGHLIDVMKEQYRSRNDQKKNLIFVQASISIENAIHAQAEQVAEHMIKEYELKQDDYAAVPPEVTLEETKEIITGFAYSEMSRRMRELVPQWKPRINTDIVGQDAVELGLENMIVRSIVSRNERQPDPSGLGQGWRTPDDGS